MMRKLSMVTIVGLIVFLVAGIGAAVAWERHGNAADINANRKERIEQAFDEYGRDSGASYGAGYAQETPDVWAAAGLVLVCVAVGGALSAAAGLAARPTP